VPNFKTYEEAQEYVNHQWDTIHEERLRWWNRLTPAQQKEIIRSEILSNEEYTPWYKQKLLNELESEVIV